MNLVGALLSTGVAVTVVDGVIAPPTGSGGLAVVLAAIVGAIVWNVVRAAVLVIARPDRRLGRRGAGRVERGALGPA
ncbi:hypothetical protein [Kutzneria sp. NPDC051319]|uniref:hypothetical protein n=1 Tax=Kutzneria sp. NPDC051319 TaxID=3155047 RepID=UPI00343E3BD3